MHKDKGRKILIDWGTTNLRAFLVDAEGKILEQRDSDKGIKSVQAGGFLEVFQEITHGWSDVSCTLMAGMVGSANGWEEAPYTPLPASITEIEQSIHPLSVLDDVYIVGGLSYLDPSGSYDVIRGEEVQILGLLDKTRPLKGENREKKIVCLPGTHSKWLEIDGEHITAFNTVMSGDFFSAVCKQTIMSLMLKVKQVHSPETFLRGVSTAGTPGGVMSRMFKVRTASLFGQIEPEHIESMISGIIIGSEIDEAQKLYHSGETVHVIGSASLNQKYGDALEQFDIDYVLHEGEKLSLTGMIRLAESL